jgi:hypothetical protein
MTPRPPTVDHLPSSGVQKTIGPKLLALLTDRAALIGAIYSPIPVCFLAAINSLKAINLADN